MMKMQAAMQKQLRMAIPLMQKKTMQATGTQRQAATATWVAATAAAMHMVAAAAAAAQVMWGLGEAVVLLVATAALTGAIMHPLLRQLVRHLLLRCWHHLLVLLWQGRQ
jgi:VIT1/CCC1 family predicted Fe2+/Mn2+ transporter